ncbi:MAG: DUF1553 domain-containing protein [Planctomycetaceae bacterium]
MTSRPHSLPRVACVLFTCATFACLAVFAADAPSAERTAGDPPKVDYNRDIRPILSDNCFRCHGPDAGERQADLRLDLRDEAIGEREGYDPAIVPGHPEKSPLFARVSSDDEFAVMPPPDSGKKLDKTHIELIRRWIAEGAEWRDHWAYVPPQRPEVPNIEATRTLEASGSLVRNEIDRFILAKLHEKKLAPSPEADRATLIRRLSFDLTGLPPTPEQVAQFVADDGDDAYEKLVDRLLATPEYGERMAIFWLDQVRYGDTGGYHSDNHREVWLYRDWVIDAFNENMPFDRFTVEQLAGDLLENPTRDQKIASGYNRMLLTTEEGGAQPKEYQAKYDADRVRNASSVWLGGTMACCECHDHKFDPYSIKDFYSFAAFFADISEKSVGRQPQTPMPLPDQKERLDAIDARLAPLKKRLDAHTPELAAAQAVWETSLSGGDPQWMALRPESVKSRDGVLIETLEDDSILADALEVPPSDLYTLKFKLEQRGVTALRLEVMPHKTLPSHGPGLAANGNFVLGEFVVQANGEPVPIARATATHSQSGYPIANTIDGKPETGWAILPDVGKANDAIFELKTDLGPGDGDASVELVVTLLNHYGSQHALGHFRISATTAPRPVGVAGGDSLPKNVREILAVPADKRSKKQQDDLAAHYRTIAPALDSLRAEVSEIEKRRKELMDDIPTMLISTSGKPRTIRVLPRGNWLDDSGEVVEPAIPEFLGGLEVDEGRPTRLDLARWIIDEKNPLAARVFVNRLWKLMFGEGIVDTPDDFGAQGSSPTHPELLDWLAIEFVESGWDVKHILKLMALSGTYRQSSVASEELRRIDPYNKWFARQGRFVLPAEMVRDNALAVSGLLHKQIGGPSVKPYQPKGYWAHLMFPSRVWVDEKGPDQYRRGLYTYWQRTYLHPSLMAFDAPSREECVVERPRSNTPLQALVLLNDPTYVEAARAFAERILKEGGSDDAERIAFAWRTATARDPRPEEVELLREIVAKHREEYRADAKAAKELLQIGQKPVAEGTDPAELAAWTSAARVILNLHETITRS